MEHDGVQFKFTNVNRLGDMSQYALAALYVVVGNGIVWTDESVGRFKIAPRDSHLIRRTSSPIDSIHCAFCGFQQSMSYIRCV